MNRVYDKIPTGGTKFNISVRGVVRTGAVAPDDCTDRSRGLYRSVPNTGAVGTLIAKRGFHDKETATRNHTASAVP